MGSTDHDYTDPSYWNGLIKMSLSKLFILCALKEESRHGYAIMSRVDEMSDGCCSPTEGSIYPTLKEFHDQGYVTAETQLTNGRERTIYELTEKGKEAFKVGLSAWRNATSCLEESL